MTHDPLDILLNHNAWASGKVYERCRGLSEDELHQKFDIGLGSIHDTLHHNIAGYRWWTDRVAGRDPPRAFLESGALRHSLAELEALSEEADRDVRRVVTDLRRDNLLTDILMTRQPPGRKLSRTTALMHMFTHAIHHRSQVLNMLRRLRPNETPLEIDITIWQIESES